MTNMKNHWLFLLIFACDLSLGDSSRLRGGEQIALQLAPPPLATPAAPKSLSNRPDTGRNIRAGIDENLKKNAAIKAAFRETIAPVSAATVRVLAEGKPVALGTVVDANGYILSKASLLQGALTCRFKYGRELDATLAGEDNTNDLALLRVDAKGLPAIEWRSGESPPSGSIVAAVGMSAEPLAVGVISADLRRIPGSNLTPGRQGWLGISLNAKGNGVIVENVLPDSPAERASFKVGDQIININNQSIKTADQAIELVTRNAPGDLLKLSVQREKQDVEIAVRLGQRPKPVGPSPEDKWGGGPFSIRRYGFPAVLPHDIAISPSDCGGPLVDTDGKVVGINIARALRVSSYAIPAATVQQIAKNMIARDIEKGRAAENKNPPDKTK
jgi:serine protease Do